jgi:BlaI family transcriptional regulator, penicillinase repressor
VHDSDAVRASCSLLKLIPGPLEQKVMKILWSRGESTVRDIVNSLDRSLAYTTVMTTCDRLFRKDLVKRRKCERAYLYSPLVTCEQWKGQVVQYLIAKLLAESWTSPELLLGYLSETINRQDLRKREKNG